MPPALLHSHGIPGPVQPLQGSRWPRTARPEPAGSWGCVSRPPNGPGASLPPPKVGLDGVGRSHGRDETHGVRQPEGDVLRGAGGG